MPPPETTTREESPALPIGGEAAAVPQTPARREILRLHKQIFERQRRLINARVHGYTDAFRKYEARFQKRVRTFERTATMDEIAQEASTCDVVHVGDYHTLKQAQRAYVKLVRRIAEAGREVVLALEFVEARRQDAVDGYLAGTLAEEAFLEGIGYPGHGFAVWDHFKPIFDAARALGLPVVALERARGGSLEERDRFWARRIARMRRERPGAVVVTLVGQLHCAPEHLPAEVEAASGDSKSPARNGIPRVKQLVVYQNAEGIYWELERRAVELDTQAVKVRDGEFNLVNTSPVVVQQSYLDWVEGDGELVETTQPERHFKELAALVARFLELEIGDALEQVEVFTAGDLSFLEKLGRLFSKAELALVRRQIVARESYYIPRAKIAYLANLSMNHAAEEAAHFLRHVVTGEEEPERGLIDSFYGRALEEALAFFGSKIANPRRKCPHVEDFERLRRTGDPATRLLADAVLTHKALEERRRAPPRRVVEHPDVDLFNAVTHSLGYILGDQLYYALVRGLVPKEEARELFMDPFAEDGDAFHAYFHLVERVGRVRVPRHP